MQRLMRVVLALAVIVALSIVAMRAKAHWSSSLTDADDESRMLKRYLLEDSAMRPLEGLGIVDKPKLWIHTVYDRNARKWSAFAERTNTNLNQPWLSLTVETLVNRNAEDFHVCLIDDESFLDLLGPDRWPFGARELRNAPEPQRTQLREIGLLKLLQRYGGIVVPNSFVCFQGLRGIYDDVAKRPFVTEAVAAAAGADAPYFVPSTYFMGGAREDAFWEEMIAEAERLYARHLHHYDFCGNWERWLSRAVDEGQLTLVGGERVGVKTRRKGASRAATPVSLESLFQEKRLRLAQAPGFLGLYLPAEDILRRIHYQWFSVLSREEILEASFVAAKYIQSALLRVQQKA